MANFAIKLANMKKDQKICTKCGEAKAVDAENFYVTKVRKLDGRVYVCFRPECKACSVAYAMKRNKVCSDPNYKIRRALAGGGGHLWVAKTLGYTVDELRTHLEKQFTKGMTWERFFRGDIHIDHITPLRSFIESGSAIDAWRISNLRPIWACENLAKSGRLKYLL